MTNPNTSDLSTRCPGCFDDQGGLNPCPRCGYDEQAGRSPLLLPHRTLLHEQFVVGRMLGKPGGFGITYLGWDLQLETRVAIKEYLPRELVARASDHATVAPHTRDDDGMFRFGLDQFLREARTLARLDHPNIVRVRHFFESNGTAYLVMDFYDGVTLAEHLERQGGRLPEATARQLLMPLLDGLRAVHAKGFLHRDVKPQNIYLARTDSGGVRPILLDFGTARHAMGERSRSLSVVISPGYAPFEQYHGKGIQGPWTDVYSAAAVLYRMVTGETPPEATERRDRDTLKPADTFGVSPGLSRAIAAAMTQAPEARPQTVQAFQALLSGTPLPVPRRRVWMGWSAVAVLLAAGGGFAWWKAPGPGGADPVPAGTGARPVVPLPLPVTSPKPAADPCGPAGCPQSAVLPPMVPMAAGKFKMGCQPNEQKCEGKEESPSHQVQLAAFEIGRFEVTFAQWDACVADRGCAYQPPDQNWGRGERPVINVSWDDAQDYLTWLSRKTGQAYRLPSEAEWEYAARAGTHDAFSTGPCITARQANYDGTGADYAGCGANTGVALGRTAAVGSYPANPWGLFDMHGNVWEWVADCWNPSYRGAPTDGSARLTGDCARRVVRGGSWHVDPWFLRAGVRAHFERELRDRNTGFRVARTLSP